MPGFSQPSCDSFTPNQSIFAYLLLQKLRNQLRKTSQPPLNSSHPQGSSFLPFYHHPRTIQTSNHTPVSIPVSLCHSCTSQFPSSSQGFTPLLELQISAEKAVPYGSTSTFWVTYLVSHLGFKKSRSREDFCGCGIVKKIPVSGPLRAECLLYNL